MIEFHSDGGGNRSGNSTGECSNERENSRRGGGAKLENFQGHLK